MENFILYDIIFLFYYLFCYTHDVVGRYAIEVLCCKWTLWYLVDGTANCIIYFNNYGIVTDVIVTKVTEEETIQELSLQLTKEYP